MDVRVLWLHSAAWMALDVFAAEQLSVPGHLPLVLDVAGSRVAEAVVSAKAKQNRDDDMVDFIVAEGRRVGG